LNSSIAIGFSLVHTLDATGVFDHRFHRVIIDQTELGAVNLEARASVGTTHDEITFFAPRAAWETILV
jgi:hypothetical protein